MAGLSMYGNLVLVYALVCVPYAVKAAHVT